MCRNVHITLGMSFILGIIRPEKCPKLAQTFARKIGKPRLISMSQKINTIDFFRYKKAGQQRMQNGDLLYAIGFSIRKKTVKIFV